MEIAIMLYNNGANYYISKPVEISHLKKTVQDIITRIAEGEILQPAIENFVLTVERRNYQKLFWFNEFFVIPFGRGN